MTDDQPHAIITSEIRKAWNHADDLVARSLYRARRELESLACDICGTPLKVVPGTVLDLRYRCQHGPISSVGDEE